MSTPVVAAASALIEQYFALGFYPSGAPTPSAATNTSAGAGGAVPIPDNVQGFGKVSLDTVLELQGSGRDLWVRDSALPGAEDRLAPRRKPTLHFSPAAGRP